MQDNIEIEYGRRGKRLCDFGLVVLGITSSALVITAGVLYEKKSGNKIPFKIGAIISTAVLSVGIIVRNLVVKTVEEEVEEEQQPCTDFLRRIFRGSRNNNADERTNLLLSEIVINYSANGNNSSNITGSTDSGNNVTINML